MARSQSAHRCLFPLISPDNSARLSPALLRQATYGTLKMGIYKDVRSKLTSMYGAGLPVDVASAIFAGGFSSAVANPSDVIKVWPESHAPSLTS